MPAKPFCALLRSIADYRVEACFLAALAFTLGHNAFHDRPVEIRTTRTHETVVHEVTPVRVAAARRSTHVIERPGVVGIAVPAPRAHVGSNGRIVIERGSDVSVPCAPDSPTLAAAKIVGGATCKVIRTAPSSGAGAPRALASGG